MAHYNLDVTDNIDAIIFKNKPGAWPAPLIQAFRTGGNAVPEFLDGVSTVDNLVHGEDETESVQIGDYASETRTVNEAGYEISKQKPKILASKIFSEYRFSHNAISGFIGQAVASARFKNALNNPDELKGCVDDLISIANSIIPDQGQEFSAKFNYAMTLLENIPEEQRGEYKVQVFKSIVDNAELTNDQKALYNVAIDPSASFHDVKDANKTYANRQKEIKGNSVAINQLKDRCSSESRGPGFKQYKGYPSAVSCLNALANVALLLEQASEDTSFDHSTLHKLQKAFKDVPIDVITAITAMKSLNGVTLDPNTLIAGQRSALNTIIEFAKNPSAREQVYTIYNKVNTITKAPETKGHASSQQLARAVQDQVGPDENEWQRTNNTFKDGKVRGLDKQLGSYEQEGQSDSNRVKVTDQAKNAMSSLKEKMLAKVHHRTGSTSGDQEPPKPSSRRP